MTLLARVILAAHLLLLASLPLAAQQAKECSLCGGVVSDLTTVPPAVVPLLLEVDQSKFDAAGEFMALLSAEQRAKTTVIVSVTLFGEDPLAEAEKKVFSIIEWTTRFGPVQSLGLEARQADAQLEAYVLKRLAVNAEGRELTANLILPPHSVDRLKALYETGAQAYFDEILVTDGSIEELYAWLVENDPIKKIVGVVNPSHPNALYDVADAFRRGATRAYLRGPVSVNLLQSVAQLNREMAGDYAFDGTSSIDVLKADGTAGEGSALAFVRGEDLRTLIFPQGNAAATSIISLPGDEFITPRRIDARGENRLTDTGKRRGRFLMGINPSAQPFVLSVDRPAITDTKITRESIDVVTEKGITVEEIIRRHQAYWAFQISAQPRYIARNETKLRFSVSDAAEAIEATLGGDYFVDPAGASDWVWQDFLINGVRWKYGSIPELPLVQPEKVTQLPLDIHLSNDYRYDLVKQTTLRGNPVYEVRFEPPPNAPQELPLYRGTVWIDQKSFARVRIGMIQLNLTGEVLSNEERVDYIPFDAETHAPLTPEEAKSRSPRSLRWLPIEVNAQQVLSTAGRSTVILRETDFTNFRIDPPNFTELHQLAGASNARMVRETDHGLRYLERTDSGQRVVKEGFDTARLFLVGGLHHDDGLEFPVLPLGGIDYFNFDLGGRGLQTNVFFAGVILAANLTDPSYRGTRTDLGADFFGIAIPFENSIYRRGSESIDEKIKALPVGLTLRAGHPILNFGKADVSLNISHISYQRAEDTAPWFTVPSNTFVLTPGLKLRYDRWGYSLSTFYEFGKRTGWEPWGDLRVPTAANGDYDEKHSDFSKYGFSLGKSFYLPKFQRVGVELDYLDGIDLDRFSKYELGFFGAQRIRGIQSGAVRAERAILGHLSYGFVFSDQFRMEIFYDHGLIDDASSGYSREPFQGVGLGGQTIGPWGTVLRIDLGKTIGANAQDDFVANVVFLKLFG